MKPVSGEFPVDKAVAYAAGAFCRNIESFVEWREEHSYWLVLRTQHYCLQERLRVEDVSACNAGSLAATTNLMVRTEQLCRELLAAEKRGPKLPQV